MKNLPVNLIRIVQTLNDGLAHSGDDLGQILKITRSAIWKAIKKLQQYGVKIDAGKGKGYTLLEPLILLDKTQIQRQLVNQNFTQAIDIKVFASLDSTNEYLKKTPAKAKHIAVCLAEKQTGGKGRLNRTWYSPFAKNIYFSCQYHFNKDLIELAGLSLIVNLATLAVLKNYCQQENLWVKWPSDIICDSKKVSGNLIEIRAEANGSSEAIIGIGININMLNEKHSFSCTSLREITGQYIDRNQFCAELIITLVDYLQRFSAHGFDAFKSEWVTNDYLTNKLVSLSHQNKKISGKVQGVNSSGCLLLKLPTGEDHIFSTGDVVVCSNSSKL